MAETVLTGARLAELLNLDPKVTTRISIDCSGNGPAVLTVTSHILEDDQKWWVEISKYKLVTFSEPLRVGFVNEIMNVKKEYESDGL